MTVRKVTISLDEQAAALAERSAAAEGMSLSAWLSKAATGQARVDEGLRAVAEYEAAYGAPTDEEMEATRCELAGLGFGQPEPPDERARRLNALRRFYGEDLPDVPAGAA
ncbi:MAG: hypothetical protein ACRDQU_06690 [Pseudonocardiaceae bacterium]